MNFTSTKERFEFVVMLNRFHCGKMRKSVVISNVFKVLVTEQVVFGMRVFIVQ